MGLAMMAWRLANLRTFGDMELPDGGHLPASRERTTNWMHRASREYYNIIDRIARGERP